MGYSQEIIAYQNPNFRKSQLFELYQYMVENGWSLLSRKDNSNIHYSIKAGDWLKLPIEELSKFEALLKQQANNRLWTSIEFKNEKLDRLVWFVQYDNVYYFELQIESNNKEEVQWFEKFHNELITAVNSLNHILYTEWRTGYDNRIFRMQTNIRHEGVLLLCSANQLKEHYQNVEFDYAYPHGLYDLFRKKIAIAIDCKDYEFTTILEKEKLSDWDFGYYNSIDFTEYDELLVLNHADFTMICDGHGGDFIAYGWKHIIHVPILQKGEQSMLIAKPKDASDNRLVIQFTSIERKLKKNFWIEYDAIPTHSQFE